MLRLANVKFIFVAIVRLGSLFCHHIQPSRMLYFVRSLASASRLDNEAGS